jgi:hypothetical protein
VACVRLRHSLGRGCGHGWQWQKPAHGARVRGMAYLAALPPVGDDLLDQLDAAGRPNFVICKVCVPQKRVLKWRPWPIESACA